MKTQNIALSLLALFLFCAVGLVLTNPAPVHDDDDELLNALAPYDDTLNAECGYERGTVNFRAALRDKAKKALQEVQDEGYLSSIGSGMSIGMLGGGAGCAVVGSFGGPASAIACGALGAIGGGISGAFAGAFAHHDAIADAEDAVKSAEERLAKAQQELAACVLALPAPIMEAPSSPNGNNSRLKNNN